MKSGMKQICTPYDFSAVHALLTQAFGYMEGRIDPPSSLHQMTPETIAQDATSKELWVIEDAGQPIACMFLTPKNDTLYLGKLAVDGRYRGQGLARQMIEKAESRALALALPTITLQTRIELTENHATFAALGFVQTDATAHEGYDRPTSVTFTKMVAAGPTS